MIPKDLGTHTRHVLKVMHDKVGAPFKDVTSENWFHKYYWTSKQQDEFIEWLAQYVMDNKEARHEMCSWKSKNKKMMKKFAQEFVFQYGWIIKY